ncbi:MAG: response regulator [Magnetococcales bacterium]|nr:response regulator [Magnetococcales bacterium]
MTADVTPEKPAILIVDDTPENLDILKQALIDDYVVRPAINGKLALRLAQRTPQPDLILLDIMMPEMDGFEVCRQLKLDASTQDIPVIFITAKTGIQDQEKGFQMGAVDYITKPINPHIVQTRVKSHLAKRFFDQKLQENTIQLIDAKEKLTENLAKLASCEERFKGLVQTIPDIVYKIDSEGRFTFLNKSINRLGYEQSELIGKHFTEIIHQDDINFSCLNTIIERIGKGTVNPDQKVFDERRSGLRMTTGLEIRLKTKSGDAAEMVEFKNIDDNLVGVEVNSTGIYGLSPPDETTQSRPYVGTVGIIRDITERLQTQKALEDEKRLLKQLIDMLPQPIFLLETNGKLISFNTAFEKMSGCSQTDQKEWTLHNLFGVEISEKLEPLLSTLTQDPGLHEIQKEFFFPDHDVHKKPIKIHFSKFKKAQQKKPAIIGLFLDKTEGLGSQ